MTYKEEVSYMKSLKYIKSVFLMVITSVVLTSSSICVDKVVAEPIVETTATNYVQNTQLSPHTIVNVPKNYLNKTVTFNAKFDKFSTLGLDYKPALKSSEEYISFLVKREDTTFDIPLSEMKLFL